MTPEKIAAIFKALSDKTRAHIVGFLAQHGESSCQDLSRSIRLSQPTLCHHFMKLAGAGVIQIRKQGVNNFYRLNVQNLTAAGIDPQALGKINK